MTEESPVESLGSVKDRIAKFEQWKDGEQKEGAAADSVSIASKVSSVAVEASASTAAGREVEEEKKPTNLLTASVGIVITPHTPIVSDRDDDDDDDKDGEDEKEPLEVSEEHVSKAEIKDVREYDDDGELAEELQPSEEHVALAEIKDTTSYSSSSDDEGRGAEKKMTESIEEIYVAETFVKHDEEGAEPIEKSPIYTGHAEEPAHSSPIISEKPIAQEYAESVSSLADDDDTEKLSEMAKKAGKIVGGVVAAPVALAAAAYQALKSDEHEQEEPVETPIPASRKYSDEKEQSEKRDEDANLFTTTVTREYQDQEDDRRSQLVELPESSEHLEVGPVGKASEIPEEDDLQHPIIETTTTTTVTREYQDQSEDQEEDRRSQLVESPESSEHLEVESVGKPTERSEEDDLQHPIIETTTTTTVTREYQDQSEDQEDERRSQLVESPESSEHLEIGSVGKPTERSEEDDLQHPIIETTTTTTVTREYQDQSEDHEDDRRSQLVESPESSEHLEVGSVGKPSEGPEDDLQHHVVETSSATTTVQRDYSDEPELIKEPETYSAAPVEEIQKIDVVKMTTSTFKQDSEDDYSQKGSKQNLLSEAHEEESDGEGVGSKIFGFAKKAGMVAGGVIAAPVALAVVGGKAAYDAIKKDKEDEDDDEAETDERSILLEKRDSPVQLESEKDVRLIESQSYHKDPEHPSEQVEEPEESQFDVTEEKKIITPSEEEDQKSIDNVPVEDSTIIESQSYYEEAKEEEEKINIDLSPHQAESSASPTHHEQKDFDDSPAADQEIYDEESGFPTFEKSEPIHEQFGSEKDEESEDQKKPEELHHEFAASTTTDVTRDYSDEPEDLKRDENDLRSQHSHDDSHSVIEKTTPTTVTQEYQDQSEDQEDDRRSQLVESQESSEHLEVGSVGKPTEGPEEDDLQHPIIETTTTTTVTREYQDQSEDQEDERKSQLVESPESSEHLEVGSVGKPTEGPEEDDLQHPIIETTTTTTVTREYQDQPEDQEDDRRSQLVESPESSEHLEVGSVGKPTEGPEEDDLQHPIIETTTTTTVTREYQDQPEDQEDDRRSQLVESPESSEHLEVGSVGKASEEPEDDLQHHVIETTTTTTVTREYQDHPEDQEDDRRSQLVESPESSEHLEVGSVGKPTEGPEEDDLQHPIIETTTTTTVTREYQDQPEDQEDDRRSQLVESPESSEHLEVGSVGKPTEGPEEDDLQHPIIETTTTTTVTREYQDQPEDQEDDRRSQLVESPESSEHLEVGSVGKPTEGPEEDDLQHPIIETTTTTTVTREYPDQPEDQEDDRRSQLVESPESSEHLEVGSVGKASEEPEDDLQHHVIETTTTTTVTREYQDHPEDQEDDRRSQLVESPEISEHLEVGSVGKASEEPEDDLQHHVIETTTTTTVTREYQDHPEDQEDDRRSQLVESPESSKHLEVGSVGKPTEEDDVQHHIIETSSATTTVQRDYSDEPELIKEPETYSAAPVEEIKKIDVVKMTTSTFKQDSEDDYSQKGSKQNLLSEAHEEESDGEGVGSKIFGFAKKAGMVAGGVIAAPVALAVVGGKAAYDAIKKDKENEDDDEAETDERSILLEKRDSPVQLESEKDVRLIESQSYHKDPEHPSEQVEEFEKSIIGEQQEPDYDKRSIDQYLTERSEDVGYHGDEESAVRYDQENYDALKQQSATSSVNDDQADFNVIQSTTTVTTVSRENLAQDFNRYEDDQKSDIDESIRPTITTVTTVESEYVDDSEFHQGEDHQDSSDNESMIYHTDSPTEKGEDHQRVFETTTKTTITKDYYDEDVEDQRSEEREDQEEVESEERKHQTHRILETTTTTTITREYPDEKEDDEEDGEGVDKKPDPNASSETKTTVVTTREFFDEPSENLSDEEKEKHHVYETVTTTTVQRDLEDDEDEKNAKDLDEDQQRRHLVETTTTTTTYRDYYEDSDQQSVSEKSANLLDDDQTDVVGSIVKSQEIQDLQLARDEPIEKTSHFVESPDDFEHEEIGSVEKPSEEDDLQHRIIETTTTTTVTREYQDQSEDQEDDRRSQLVESPESSEHLEVGSVGKPSEGPEDDLQHHVIETTTTTTVTREYQDQSEDQEDERRSQLVESPESSEHLEVGSVGKPSEGPEDDLQRHVIETTITTTVTREYQDQSEDQEDERRSQLVESPESSEHLEVGSVGKPSEGPEDDLQHHVIETTTTTTVTREYQDQSEDQEDERRSQLVESPESSEHLEVGSVGKPSEGPEDDLQHHVIETTTTTTVTREYQDQSEDQEDERRSQLVESPESSEHLEVGSVGKPSEGPEDDLQRHVIETSTATTMVPRDYSDEPESEHQEESKPDVSPIKEPESYSAAPVEEIQKIDVVKMTTSTFEQDSEDDYSQKGSQQNLLSEAHEEESDGEGVGSKIFGFAKKAGMVAGGVIAAPVALAVVGGKAAYDAIKKDKEDEDDDEAETDERSTLLEKRDSPVQLESEKDAHLVESQSYQKDPEHPSEPSETPEEPQFDVTQEKKIITPSEEEDQKSIDKVPVEDSTIIESQSYYEEAKEEEEKINIDLSPHQAEPSASPTHEQKDFDDSAAADQEIYDEESGFPAFEKSEPIREQFGSEKDEESEDQKKSEELHHEFEAPTTTDVTRDYSDEPEDPKQDDVDVRSQHSHDDSHSVIEQTTQEHSDEPENQKDDNRSQFVESPESFEHLEVGLTDKPSEEADEDDHQHHLLETTTTTTTETREYQSSSEDQKEDRASPLVESSEGFEHLEVESEEKPLEGQKEDDFQHPIIETTTTTTVTREYQDQSEDQEDDRRSQLVESPESSEHLEVGSVGKPSEEPEDDLQRHVIETTTTKTVTREYQDQSDDPENDVSDEKSEEVQSIQDSTIIESQSYYEEAKEDEERINVDLLSHQAEPSASLTDDHKDSDDSDEKSIKSQISSEYQKDEENSKFTEASDDKSFDDLDEIHDEHHQPRDSESMEGQRSPVHLEEVSSEKDVYLIESQSYHKDPEHPSEQSEQPEESQFDVTEEKKIITPSSEEDQKSTDNVPIETVVHSDVEIVEHSAQEEKDVDDQEYVIESSEYQEHRNESRVQSPVMSESESPEKEVDNIYEHPDHSVDAVDDHESFVKGEEHIIESEDYFAETENQPIDKVHSPTRSENIELRRSPTSQTAEITEKYFEEGVVESQEIRTSSIDSDEKDRSILSTVGNAPLSTDHREKSEDSTKSEQFLEDDRHIIESTEYHPESTSEIGILQTEKESRPQREFDEAEEQPLDEPTVSSNIEKQDFEDDWSQQGSQQNLLSEAHEEESDGEGVGSKIFGFAKKAGMVAGGVIAAPVALAVVGGKAAYDAIKKDKEDEDDDEAETDERSTLLEKRDSPVQLESEKDVHLIESQSYHKDPEHPSEQSEQPEESQFDVTEEKKIITPSEEEEDQKSIDKVPVEDSTIIESQSYYEEAKEEEEKINIDLSSHQAEPSASPTHHEQKDFDDSAAADQEIYDEESGFPTFEKSEPIHEQFGSEKDEESEDQKKSEELHHEFAESTTTDVIRDYSDEPDDPKRDEVDVRSQHSHDDSHSVIEQTTPTTVTQEHQDQSEDQEDERRSQLVESPEGFEHLEVGSVGKPTEGPEDDLQRHIIETTTTTTVTREYQDQSEDQEDDRRSQLVESPESSEHLEVGSVGKPSEEDDVQRHVIETTTTTTVTREYQDQSEDQEDDRRSQLVESPESSEHLEVGSVGKPTEGPEDDLQRHIIETTTTTTVTREYQDQSEDQEDDRRSQLVESPESSEHLEVGSVGKPSEEDDVQRHVIETTTTTTVTREYQDQSEDQEDDRRSQLVESPESSEHLEVGSVGKPTEGPEDDLQHPIIETTTTTTVTREYQDQSEDQEEDRRSQLVESPESSEHLEVGSVGKPSEEDDVQRHVIETTTTTTVTREYQDQSEDQEDDRRSQLVESPESSEHLEVGSVGKPTEGPEEDDLQHPIIETTTTTTVTREYQDQSEDQEEDRRSQLVESPESSEHLEVGSVGKPSEEDDLQRHVIETKTTTTVTREYQDQSEDQEDDRRLQLVESPESSEHLEVGSVGKPSEEDDLQRHVIETKTTTTVTREYQDQSEDQEDDRRSQLVESPESSEHLEVGSVGKPSEEDDLQRHVIETTTTTTVTREYQDQSEDQEDDRRSQLVESPESSEHLEVGSVGKPSEEDDLQRHVIETTTTTTVTREYQDQSEDQEDDRRSQLVESPESSEHLEVGSVGKPSEEDDVQRHVIETTTTTTVTREYQDQSEDQEDDRRSQLVESPESSEHLEVGSVGKPTEGPEDDLQHPIIETTTTTTVTREYQDQSEDQEEDRRSQLVESPESSEHLEVGSVGKPTEGPEEDDLQHPIIETTTTTTVTREYQDQSEDQEEDRRSQLVESPESSEHLEVGSVGKPTEGPEEDDLQHPIIETTTTTTMTREYQDQSEDQEDDRRSQLVESPESSEHLEVGSVGKPTEEDDVQRHVIETTTTTTMTREYQDQSEDQEEDRRSQLVETPESSEHLEVGSVGKPTEEDDLQHHVVETSTATTTVQRDYSDKPELIKEPETYSAAPVEEIKKIDVVKMTTSTFKQDSEDDYSQQGSQQNLLSEAHEEESDGEGVGSKIFGFAKKAGMVAGGVIAAPVALAVVGGKAAYDAIKKDKEDEDDDEAETDERSTLLEKRDSPVQLESEKDVHLIESQSYHKDPEHPSEQSEQPEESQFDVTEEKKIITPSEEEDQKSIDNVPVEKIVHPFVGIIEHPASEEKFDEAVASVMIDTEKEKFAETEERSSTSPTHSDKNQGGSQSDNEFEIIEKESDDPIEITAVHIVSEVFDPLDQHLMESSEYQASIESLDKPKDLKTSERELISDEEHLVDEALSNVKKVSYGEESIEDDDWKVYNRHGEVLEEFSTQLTDDVIQEAEDDASQIIVEASPRRSAFLKQESCQEVTIEPEVDYYSDLQEKLNILANEGKPVELNQEEVEEEPSSNSDLLDVIQESDQESNEQEADEAEKTAARLVDDVMKQVLDDFDADEQKTVTSDAFFTATEQSKDDQYDTCVTSQDDTYESAQGWTSQDSEYTSANSGAPSRLSDNERQDASTPQAILSPVDSDRHFTVSQDFEMPVIRAFDVDDLTTTTTARSTPDVPLQVTIEEEDESDDKLPISPSGILLPPSADPGRPISPIPPPRNERTVDDENVFVFVHDDVVKETPPPAELPTILDNDRVHGVSMDASSDDNSVSRYSRQTSDLSSESQAETVIHREKSQVTDQEVTDVESMYEATTRSGSSDSIDKASIISGSQSSVIVKEQSEHSSPEDLSAREQHEDVKKDEEAEQLGFEVYGGEEAEELETVEEEPEDSDSLNGGSGNSSVGVPSDTMAILGKYKHTSSDNLSLTSLQEFERLEKEVEKIRGDGSLTRSEIELLVQGKMSRSGEGSVSSLAEFERLEKEVAGGDNLSPQDEVMMLSDIREESEAEDMSIRDDDEDVDVDVNTSDTEMKSRPLQDEDLRATTPLAVAGATSPTDSLERRDEIHAQYLETSTDSLEPTVFQEIEVEHKEENADDSSLIEYEMVPNILTTSTTDSLDGGTVDKDSLLEGASQGQESQSTHELLSGDTIGTVADDDDKDSLDGDIEAVLRSYPTTLTTFQTTSVSPDGSVQTISRRVETKVTDPLVSHVTFTGTESQERLDQLPDDEQFETVDSEGNVTRTIFRRQHQQQQQNYCEPKLIF